MTDRELCLRFFTLPCGMCSTMIFSCFVLWQVSPNHKLLAVTEDFTGDEVYSIRVIDIETGQSVGNLITGSTEQIEWAEDNEILFYVSQDEVHRPYKVKYTLSPCQLPVGDWLFAECVLCMSP